MVRVSIIACDSVCMGGRGRVTVRATCQGKKLDFKGHGKHSCESQGDIDDSQVG